MFSKDIQRLLDERFPGIDLNEMSVEELEAFKLEVDDLRHEYALLENAYKVCANAGYGSAANEFFYFFLPMLASDITAECRNLTQTMWHNLEHFFHEDLWNRKDIQHQFGFELDESKHDWYREQIVSCYSDTDSVYTTYGNLFRAMTEESQKKFDTVEKKILFILKFNKEFLDKQNNKWCDEIFNPRHGKNIHEFELETISAAQLNITKKQYIKGLVYSKGKFFEQPKLSATGVELVKGSSPMFCRKNLPKLLNKLMFEFDPDHKEEFIMEFIEDMADLRRRFYQADIESISQSVNIGNYKKYVIDDKEMLRLGKQCPTSVHAIARYNYLAHKNGHDDLIVKSGKIKYYNITIGRQHLFFGYPAGMLPSWAPPMDKYTQWEKNVIVPINRFLDVMDIPKMLASEAQQMTLFV